MKLVYFDERFMEAAPPVMGALMCEETHEWIDLPLMVAALRTGDTVSIRQASAAELKRAEQLTAMYQIAQQLNIQVRTVLDDHPAEAEVLVTTMRAAMEDLGATQPAFSLIEEKAEGKHGHS